MDKFKPLLAGKAPDFDKLRYPLLASPKLDGIRCVKLNGKALTRSLKPIPNVHVREWVEMHLPDGIDGELMLRDHRTPFNEVTSAIMGRSGEPDFVFQAFDLLARDPNWTAGGMMPGRPFSIRFSELENVVARARTVRLQVVPHVMISDEVGLQAVTTAHLEEGYEGTMLRDPAGIYKFGRSTDKEGILLKVKHFDDEEAEVLGIEEEMENANEATTNALGRTERSTKKEGMRGKGRVGRLICKFGDGTEFGVGSGLNDELKREFWTKSPVGRTVKIKHQPAPGGRKAGEAPRFPVFLGFRED
jgi:DNA ligase-1